MQRNHLAWTKWVSRKPCAQQTIWQTAAGQFALNAMTGLVSAVLYFYTEKVGVAQPRRPMYCWRQKSWTRSPTLSWARS